MRNFTSHFIYIQILQMEIFCNQILQIEISTLSLILFASKYFRSICWGRNEHILMHILWCLLLGKTALYCKNGTRSLYLFGLCQLFSFLQTLISPHKHNTIRRLRKLKNIQYITHHPQILITYHPYSGGYSSGLSTREVLSKSSFSF